jgi:hypothetical protein
MIMKKVISLLLVFTLIFSLASFCFATVTTYDKPKTEVTSKSVSKTDKVTVADEEIPQGSVLPKTGGIPAEVFYIAGALLVVGH